MKHKDKKKQQFKNGRPWWRWLFLVLAIVLMIGLVKVWAIEFIYAGRVAYGVKLGNYDVGGMTLLELNNFFDRTIENIKDGVKFTSNGELIENKSFSELGLWMQIDECQNDLWKIGKSQNMVVSYYDRLLALAGKKEIRCKIVFDKIAYDDWIKYVREKYNHPAVSASVEKKDGLVVVSNSSEGEVVDENRLMMDLSYKLSILDFSAIELVSKKDIPAITDEMAVDIKKKVEKEIKQGRNWLYEDNQLEVKGSDIYDMLFIDQVQKEGTNQPQLKLTYDLSAIDSWLNENAYMYEDKPRDARLKMTESGPEIVEAGTSGKQVNRTKLVELLNTDLGDPKLELKLPVEKMEAMVTADNLASLGVKELIASGTSDFSWSPANRIHNISVGADQFNGTVIAPGEEFSFTTRLGSVDAAKGYLPELVIADNETRPEYGGGLCQVSTTMYRVALDAGFPITDRTPHQYRVSYYEPAGQDATIYIPNPDLKFINDTKHYVLIEAVMGDNTLTFNFYGTSDGRKVEVTDPEIFNITSPPAAVYIHNSSLAAGETIQIDSAHYGADSIFYRYITYPDGKRKEEEIFSRYQAWPAKFKVGEGEVQTNDANNSTDTNTQTKDINSDPNNELGYDLDEVLKDLENKNN